MTDQTGAEQQGAAGSRTGDVDVADESRPDVTTDVQSGGATDLDAGGPDAGTATDDAAIRGGEDADAPRSERGRSDQQRDDTHAADDTDDGRDGSSRNEVRGDDEDRRGSDENVRGSKEDGQAADEERQKTAEEFAREHDPEKHDVAAGEEFRQEGDWTADDAGGPQVWDSEGHLVEGSTPGEPESKPVRVKPVRVRPVRIGPVRGSGRPVPGGLRRRTAHVLAGRDPRRWLRRRLGRADRRRGRPARAPRQGVGGHQDVRRARPREVRRGRAARVVRRRARGPASGLPSRRLTPGSAVQVGSGNESADAPSARSTAWRVGRIDVPSVRLPGIPRLRA